MSEDFLVWNSATKKTFDWELAAVTGAQFKRRVSKLERAHPSANLRWFLVWGCDEKDLADRVAAAVQLLGSEAAEEIMACIWPEPSQPPGARWTELQGLSDDELTALTKILAQQRSLLSG